VVLGPKVQCAHRGADGDEGRGKSTLRTTTIGTRRGCAGWDWDSLLPFFEKAENHHRGAGPLHGVGGPLNVSDPVSRSQLADAMINAAERLGITWTDDFNAPLTNHHPSSSCAMGTGSNSVEAARRRRASRGRCLHHAVASVGNTDAPPIMIGEKAAATILEDTERAVAT
jgi:choline dehydrogenase-like flavoprotein